MRAIDFSKYTQKELLSEINKKRVIMDHQLLFFIEEGCYEVTINNERFHLDKGSLTVILPTAELCTTYISDDLLIYILSSRSIENSDSINKSRSFEYFYEHPVFIIERTCYEDILKYMKLFTSLADKSRPPACCTKAITLLSYSLEFYIRNYCLSKLKRNGMDTTNPYFYLYHDFIDDLKENIQEQRHVSFYAEKQAIHPKYFSHLIKEFSGHSPKYWITIELLYLCKNLLLGSDLSIKEISDKLNFSHIAVFSTFFKNNTGVCPQTYRETSQKYRLLDQLDDSSIHLEQP